ncbi:MAG: T9SS type A sorting domain-containing protein [Bacteroidetes bacterium]|nr:T9SS type A sorting domain-containing protein [Bacteroidota bacterium]
MTNISKFFRPLALLLIIMLNALIALPQTWSALTGGGMNDWVYATTIFNGELIVGGKFTSAGGVSANYVAKWNGTTWAPLGSGVNGKVNALIVYKGNLVVAGEFTIAGGIETNFIAQWDGSAWDDQLGGVGSIVTSLAVIGNDLYVGGYFTEADNIPVNNIAKRNSSGWHPLGSGTVGVEGQVMALTVHNNELYAGGFFTTAGGLLVNHIAKWSGTSWSALGSGIGHIVYSLSEYNGNLIAGGLFSSAGGVAANNIASWNGTAWSALGDGMSGVLYQYVWALAVYNGNLIAGGYFTDSDGITTNGIAQWNGNAWSSMGGGVFYPGNVFGVHTLCVYGSDLIVGGLFYSAGTVGAANIASWNEPTTPAVLSIQNDTVADGSFPCYNATQTIEVAGSGTSFVVQNGGMATMIAGQNILYLPGTKVDSGGYLLGYITTTANYCNNPTPPMAPVAIGESDIPSGSEASFFNIYPNPSNGVFFLEANGAAEFSNVRAEVLNMQGTRVTSFLLNHERKHQLSLSDRPAGVYFIRLISETMTETAKIIKQN